MNKRTILVGLLSLAIGVTAQPSQKKLKIPVPPGEPPVRYIECTGRSMVDFLGQLGRAYHKKFMVFRMPIDTSDDVLGGTINYKNAPCDALLRQITKVNRYYRIWATRDIIYIAPKRKALYDY
jgi:hypothetical protein